MLYPEYIKDMKNSYLLLKSMEENTLGYGSKMLLHNNISGLLKVEIRCFDELNVYYYDITGKKKILDYFDKASLKFEDIKHILTCVINILEGSLEYLLHENDFILEPEYVFVNPITNDIFLCHLVGYQVNIQTQISSFIEYLMNKVDYKDEKAVLLVYSLYKESREPNCTYGKLLSELNKKNDVQEIRPDNKEIKADKKEIKTDKKEIKTDNKELNQVIPNTHQSAKKVIKKDEKSNHVVNKRIDLKNLIIKKVSGNKDNIVKKGNVVKKEHLVKKENPVLKSTDSSYKHLLEETIGEEETLCYSQKTYLMAIISIVSGCFLLIIALVFKLLHNTFKTELDPIKVFSFLIILVTIEIYVLFRLFHEGNKITKMVSSIKYENDNYYEKESFSQGNEEESKNTMNDKGMDSEVLEYDDLTVKLYEDNKEEMMSDVTEALACFEPKLLLKPLDKDNYKYINLSRFPFLVGKSQRAVNHCFNSNTISRIHSRFEKKGDEVYLIDLNSLNGTYINGDRLVENQSYRICSGDKISFAHLNYIFQIE